LDSDGKKGEGDFNGKILLILKSVSSPPLKEKIMEDWQMKRKVREGHVEKKNSV